MTAAASSELHDRIARAVAATRFPFKGQVDWPADYVTIVNAGSPVRAIPVPSGEHFPDIVIVNGEGDTREIGEIEMAASESSASYWRESSLAADNETDSGERHFFVYVPAGEEEAAKAILDAHGISYAGVRGWAVAEDGAIEIVPFVTTGEAKDHQVTRAA
ncbi:hypothetical protein [Marinivivus vitaminiproducens]|uniref:hypothetical protein n=1 Tax=Marinivivus vitaminiproducens TaxID=3035935 RepID=UPI00279A9729|nr:hypothetical protein P4R82_20915 [Geminicoccaceae bacterium SCSIO 64248]